MPKGAMTIDRFGTFPLQELQSNGAGQGVTDACSHCRNLPRMAIYRNFYGAQMSLCSKYLDQPLKTPRRLELEKLEQDVT